MSPNEYHLNFILILTSQFIVVVNHCHCEYKKFAAAYVLSRWEFSIIHLLFPINLERCFKYSYLPVFNSMFLDIISHTSFSVFNFVRNHCTRVYNKMLRQHTSFRYKISIFSACFYCEVSTWLKLSVSICSPLNIPWTLFQ